MENPVSNIDALLDEVTSRLINLKTGEALALMDAFFVLKRNLIGGNKEFLSNYLEICKKVLPVLEIQIYHRPEKVDFEDLLLLAKCDNNAILLYSQFENARKMYETGHDDYTEFLRKKQRVFEALIEWKHKKDLDPRQEK